MNVFLLALGMFLVVWGAWSIDFAHAAWERGEPTVGIPTPRGNLQVGRAFWWNLGFFLGVVGGCFIFLVGAVL